MFVQYIYHLKGVSKYGFVLRTSIVLHSLAIFSTHSGRMLISTALAMFSPPVPCVYDLLHGVGTMAWPHHKIYMRIGLRTASEAQNLHAVVHKHGSFSAAKRAFLQLIHFLPSLPSASGTASTSLQQ